MCFHHERSDRDGVQYYTTIEVPDWCPCAVEHLMKEQESADKLGAV
jgi:hypothetical protein